MYQSFIVAYLMICKRFPVAFGAWQEKLMLSCQNRSLRLIIRARPLIKTPHPDRLLLESHLHTFLLVKYNNEHMIIKRRTKAICWELYWNNDKNANELEWKQRTFLNPSTDGTDFQSDKWKVANPGAAEICNRSFFSLFFILFSLVLEIFLQLFCEESDLCVWNC